MLTIGNDLKKASALISSTDEAFTDTEYAESGFTIEVTDLKQRDRNNLIQASVNDKGTINQGDYQAELFNASITAVDGFAGADGVALTLSNELCDNLYEYFPLIREKVIEAISGFTIRAEKKVETQESDLATIPDGV